MSVLSNFRGSLIALGVLAGLSGAWYATRPAPPDPKPAKKEKKVEGQELVTFEKANLVRVQVRRPEGTITLAERADGWWIEGEELRASKSMVNRVKHQLHDLVARATVVEGQSGQDALYGLGQGAIRVELTFRDGSTLALDAGDPNPSGVSFYIRPVGSEAVYTVKKSAVDYYSLSLDEFRERRFATFDSKDVDQLEADIPADPAAATAEGRAGRRLRFQRSGDHDWELLEPAAFSASDTEVRSLLGRVSAMKAIRFVAPDSVPGGEAAMGLVEGAAPAAGGPRAVITVRFSNGEPPLTLVLGRLTGEKDGEYPLAYAKIQGEPHVYAVRDGLLEEYLSPVEDFRLMQFARVDANDVREVTATFRGSGLDADLSQTVTVRMAADQWQWEDGVPVPGSTPERVAMRGSTVTGEAYIGEGPDAGYGLDRPVATLVLRAATGDRTLLIGGAAPPGTRAPPPSGPGERPAGTEQYDRYYARIAEFPGVYIVDGSVVEVVKDLMREHRRKAEGDAEKGARQDNIKKEMGGQ